MTEAKIVTTKEQYNVNVIKLFQVKEQEIIKVFF